MSPQDYEIDVRPLPPSLGGGFVAVVPDLPGCMSDGETPQEALENAYDAAAAWIATAAETGRDIPVSSALEQRAVA